ncbi:hypothetical protein BIFANG_03377 [Bifidobacterium angulatum DSM 20098 = JCM 7096]|uniref:Uncharacterized protein n=1 Tax=Bifidobacterium angulatum DSM 20098 = JCM 7096 TaxID=518635 RepID=C4FGA8_9BIFI|nr:hypothetical protein BIFANG_03377 [Bifidobacterium angulatum DSM 20098 = JCM 7096]
MSSQHYSSCHATGNTPHTSHTLLRRTFGEAEHEQGKNLTNHGHAEKHRSN